MRAPMKRDLTQARLKKILCYSPETGVFTWRISRRGRAQEGRLAGNINNSYMRIGIDGKSYLASRLAWLYVYGFFPEFEVDHINGEKTDNRISNLRHASRSCNMQNQKINTRNTSGFTGVMWHKGHGRWESQIGINSKILYLGGYNSKLEAALARLTAEVWDENWTCNYRCKLAKAVKKAWPEFNLKSIGGDEDD